MSRPREFDEAYVVEKIEEVFWKKGFEATAMADLAEAAGMQRGSLYNAFGDKRQLYLAVLKTYGEREYGGAAKRLKQVAEKQGAREAIHQLYETLAKDTEISKDRRGCLICNACTELAARDKKVEKFVRDYIAILQQAISDSLEHDTSLELKQAEANALADTFTATYLGLRVWTKAGFSALMVRQSATATLQVLEP